MASSKLNGPNELGFAFGMGPPTKKTRGKKRIADSQPLVDLPDLRFACSLVILMCNNRSVIAHPHSYRSHRLLSQLVPPRASGCGTTTGRLILSRRTPRWEFW